MWQSAFNDNVDKMLTLEDALIRENKEVDGNIFWKEFIITAHGLREKLKKLSKVEQLELQAVKRNPYVREERGWLKGWLALKCFGSRRAQRFKTLF